MSVHVLPRQVVAAASTLVIVQSRSRVEERLVQAWVDREHPGAEIVDASRDALLGRLDHDSRLVVPVRVVWNLPSGEDWGARLSDLVLAPMRRAPWAVLHRPLVKVAPGAASVIAGAPATCAELRRAFVKEAGRADGFEEFVVRRAVLSCERAERRLAGDRYKVPRLMIEQITASQSFMERADKAARDEGGDPASFLVRARSCLTEMVAVQSPIAIDVFRALTSPLHSRTWNVDVDTARLERLRELNKSAPLVFLPAHRSYVDPLVLAEVLHRHDFPRNHVLGGDNMSFWPFGPVGKRAGVVFIRRSFGEDAAYKFAMREYLGHLMAKRFNLEWYIEGTRTRTGKLRRPRYGMLRYLVDAVRNDPERDAVLVPVSIMYDQLHEVGAVVAEQTGATKRAEGRRWFARYVRDQSKNIGDARVSFGEPFGLREALDQAGPGPSQLEKVAFRICAGINETTPVMATSLVTLALLNTGGRALTLPQIVGVTAPLLDYLESRGIQGPYFELRDESQVLKTLGMLGEAGVVSAYRDGTEPVWSIPAEQSHIAAFYRNGAAQHLVMRSVVELGLLSAERAGADLDLVQAGTATSLALRDLLKFEFFFSSKHELRAELEHELELIDPQWSRLGASGAASEHLLGRCRTLVAPRALRHVFEAQRVLAEQLVAAPPSRAVDKVQFLAECLRVGRQRFLQGQIRDGDSVSLQLYAGAWELAANRGVVSEEVVSDGQGDLHLRRREFLDEILDVLELLDLGERRAAGLLEEVLDGHG